MISREALLFLIVGVLTVGVDFAVYNLLLPVLPVTVAKMISFAAGTVFAYVANRFITFGNKSRGSLWRFLLLYGMTLGINTGVNSLILNLLGPQAKTLAFLCATGASATLNFLGMKFLVFRMEAVRQ